MATVRTLRIQEISAAADLTARVFADPGEREGMKKLLEAAYADCPFLKPQHCFILESEGKLLAKWQLLDFEIRVAGIAVPMCGIQGVAAEPNENHKGYARRIANEALPKLADLGFDLALGFAQRGAFYLRIGAVPIAAEYTVTLDAHKIPRPEVDPFREFDESRDIPDLIDHYNRATTHISGSLVRSTDLWPWLIRKPSAIHISGEGYLGVHYRGDRIEVQEVAGSGPAFYETALRKLALLARERGLRRIHGPIPLDHPLTTAAVAYGAEFTASYSKKSGCLALPLAPLRLLGRIEGQLEKRLKNSGHGDLCAELQIECQGEVKRMKLNPSGRRNRLLRVPLSANGLLQLAFGYRSVDSVVHEEWSPEQQRKWSEEDLDLLRTLLPQGHPFMGHPDRY